MNRKNIREVRTNAKEHAVTFHDTAFQMEKLINLLKHFVAEGQITPDELIEGLDILSRQRDTIHAEGSEQILALQDMTRIAEQGERDYQELSRYTSYAYYNGFEDALDDVLRNRGDDPEVGKYLKRMLGIEEVRRYLEAGDEEEEKGDE